MAKRIVRRVYAAARSGAARIKDDIPPAAAGAAIALARDLLPATVKGGYLEAAGLAVAGHFLRQKRPALGYATLGVAGLLLAQKLRAPGGPLANLFENKADASALYWYRTPNAINQPMLQQVDRAAQLVNAAEIAEAEEDEASGLYGPLADHLLSQQLVRSSFELAEVKDPDVKAAIEVANKL